MTPPARQPRLAAVVLAAACALLLAACGNGEKVGGGVNTHVSGSARACGLFCPTASAKPKGTKAPTQVVRTTPPVRRTTPAKTQPPRTQPTAAPFNIYLNGDRSGKSLIDPPQAAVYAGTKVIWHNADVKPHGVQAQNGAFNSGPIAPGATYTWVAVAGDFAYQDSTRPYVNAELRVAPR